MATRKLNDVNPSEWDKVCKSRGLPPRCIPEEVEAMRDWYKEAEKQPWEGFNKNRLNDARQATIDSMGFLEFPAPPVREEARRAAFVAGPQNAATMGNPKAAIGALKAPMHLVPPVATIQMSLALSDGADKYGAFNWRKEHINVTTYMGAIQRHMAAYQDGEDVAQDSGVHHLAHAMACCALLLDSEALGILIDDRVTGGASELLKRVNK